MPIFLAQGDPTAHIGTLQAILKGGVPLILAVLLVIAGYVIYQLVRYIQKSQKECQTNIQELQKELQTKIQELLQKQLDQQGPLTEALTQTTQALKKADETLEENNKLLTQVKTIIKE